MADMCPYKTPAVLRDPGERRHDFYEVSQGYTTEEMAIKEASRCLNCKTRPCVGGCPVGVKIPDFLCEAAVGNWEKAYEIISDTNALPAVCGRVCPQETQCEGKCVRGIKGESVGIGRLERFVADYGRAHGFDKSAPISCDKEKVAVIGSGPSGLTAASELAKMGYKVTVFEAFHTPGGVLVYGIPEFRLPKEIVSHEVEKLKSMGVEFRLNTVIGRSYSIPELQSAGYKAVFIGTGAGLPRFMGIPGEGLIGVYSANEYLTRINLCKAYLPDSDTPILRSKAVAVVGGGNVAMDAARCAARMGAEHVYVVYRRSEKEMPARLEEVLHAKEEGIEFMTLSNPTEVLGDDSGRVKAVRCVKMALGEPDDSGRQSVSEIPGSEFLLPVDTVIMSIGTSPNPLIRRTTPGIETNRRGCIVVDEDTMKTTCDGIYAGGDAVTGAATVILAMGAGKKAAAAIDSYLKEKR